MLTTQERKTEIVDKILSCSDHTLSFKRVASLRRNLLTLNLPTLDRLQHVIFGRILRDRKQTEEIRLKLLRRKQLVRQDKNKGEA